MIGKEELDSLKLTIQDSLVKEFAPSFFFAKQALAEKKKALTEKINILLQQYIQYKKYASLSAEEKEVLIKEIIDGLLGYGPIDDLMNDTEITEIMINGPDKIYIEKAGKKTLTGVRFKNAAELHKLIQKLITYTGRKVDESTPYVDACLEDGTRINVIIPPLSLGGAVLTIRRLLKNIETTEDLVKLGTISQEVGQFLVACVRGRVNMIFSGATGVGKTTTLGVLSRYLPADERIVVIEDTAELTFRQEHVVRLQARLPNIEGKGAVTIRDLLKNALRMRPERILIGEVRGSEALDFLQAMASGHNGALGVIHAASPQDVTSRLEAIIATSGVNIPLWTIRRYIANNLNLIIQQERLQDGGRRVMHISEVRGIKDEEIMLEDIFTFEQEGLDKKGAVLGRIKATGVIPLFLPQLKKRGIELDTKIFKKET